MMSQNWTYLVPRGGAIVWRLDGDHGQTGHRCEDGDMVELHNIDLSLLCITVVHGGASVITVTSPVQLSIDDVKGANRE